MTRCPGCEWRSSLARGILMLTRRRPKTRATKVLWLLEPVLLAGVIYSLWYMTFPFYDADVGCMSRSRCRELFRRLAR